MLSSMESITPPPQHHDLHADLEAADQARDRLAAGLRLPSGLHPVLAVAIAVQISTAGVGIAQQTVTGLALVVAGMAVFLLVAALLLHRFRVINGVRVDGLASHVVLGAGSTSSLLYLGSLAAATWAAFASVWWLVAATAMAGGVGYALAARRWWHSYRNDPVAHTGEVSPRLLAGLAVIACLGLAVLLVVS